MTYAEQLATLAEESAARIDAVRRRLEPMRTGNGAAPWIEPVDALLSMVEEIVTGAKAFALGEEPGGDEDQGDELAAAVDDLRAAVMDLTGTIAELGRTPSDST